MCSSDLKWAEQIGGLPSLIARSRANLVALEKWVGGSSWAAFLVADAATRSSTSICLSFQDSAFTPERAKALVALLDKEKAAYDIGAYRDAPNGLRVWGGATVETADIEKLTPWLDWAYASV